MKPRPVIPSSSVGSFPLVPWLIVAGCAGGYGLVALAWLARRIAAVLAGNPWQGPAFDWAFVEDLIRADTQQL